MQLLLPLLLYALFALIPLYYFKKRGLNASKELCLESSKASRALKPSLVTLASLFIAALVLGIVLSFFGPSDISNVSEALKSARDNGIVFALSLTLGVALEELFFRGFLVKFLGNLLWKRAGKARSKLSVFFRKYSGALLSSAFFGLLHFGYASFAEILGAFVLGMVLALCFLKYKNLYANIYAHLLWNSLVLIVLAMA